MTGMILTPTTPMTSGLLAIGVKLTLSDVLATLAQNYCVKNRYVVFLLGN